MLKPLGMDMMEVDTPKPSSSSSSELFRAAEKGDVAAFQRLSPAECASLSLLRNGDHRSLLHVAVSSNHPHVVNFLLESSSDDGPTIAKVINSVDEEGWAPLHSAASIGNLQILQILLDKGADVNLQNNGGRTALHYAASKGWLEIALLLISHGANVNVKDKVGSTPLHRAASTGYCELCELLIEEGAKVDAADRTGQTPLMHAVICENKEVALLLIRHGANVDAQDKEEYTVLGRASNEFRPKLVHAAKTMLEGKNIEDNGLEF